MEGRTAARTVLVIGAHGALGTALVRAFEEAGWRVVAGVRRSDGAGGASPSGSVTLIRIRPTPTPETGRTQERPCKPSSAGQRMLACSVRFCVIDYGR